MSDALPDSTSHENNQLQLPIPEFPYHGGNYLSIRRHIPPPPQRRTLVREGGLQPVPKRILTLQENDEPPYSEPPSTRLVPEDSRNRYFLRPRRMLVPDRPPQPIPKALKKLPFPKLVPDDSRNGYSLQETDTLFIISEIKVKVGRDAQVVLCRRESNGIMCVAKIFDPLYQCDNGWYYADDPHPLVEAGVADRYYSAEAAAYQQLDPYIGGSAIPKYYGSWTTNITVQLSTKLATRVVCLVLMEYIPGSTLRSLADHNSLSEEQRGHIMAKAIAAETRVKSFGVLQKDFAERNVICHGKLIVQDRINPDLRVVIVDFNISCVDHFVREAKGLPPIPVPSKPISPIERWWFNYPCTETDFGPCWFPSAVDPKSNCIIQRQWRLWLIKHFGGSKEYQDPPADMIAEYASERRMEWLIRRGWRAAEAGTKGRTPDGDAKTKGRTPDGDAKTKRRTPGPEAKTKRRRQN